MGYYTSYSLKLDPTNPAILAVIRKHFSELDYAVGPKGECREAIKWYEHENDLLKISARYPDTLFILEGKGEEAGDLWKKYFKANRIQIANAHITYDNFDENKLTVPKELVHRDGKWQNIDQVWDENSQSWRVPVYTQEELPNYDNLLGDNRLL